MVFDPIMQDGKRSDLEPGPQVHIRPIRYTRLQSSFNAFVQACLVKSFTNSIYPHSASTISTLKCTHPSAYAPSLITSSSGALNGTAAPCSTGSATIGSLLLGNKLGNTLFSALPMVCTSPFAVLGGTSVWTIFMLATGEELVGEVGM